MSTEIRPVVQTCEILLPGGKASGMAIRGDGKPQERAKKPRSWDGQTTTPNSKKHWWSRKDRPEWPDTRVVQPTDVVELAAAPSSRGDRASFSWSMASDRSRVSAEGVRRSLSVPAEALGTRVISDSEHQRLRRDMMRREWEDARNTLGWGRMLID